VRYMQWCLVGYGTANTEFHARHGDGNDIVIYLVCWGIGSILDGHNRKS
jgi:hypothetical protein